MKWRNLKRNNIILFLCIMTIILIYPYLGSYADSILIRKITLSLIALSSIFALDFERTNHRIMIFTASFSIFFIWLAYLLNEKWLEISSLIIVTLFMIYALIIMVWRIARSDRINAIIIFSAVNSYLLIGVIGAILFALAEFFNPGGLCHGDTAVESFRVFIYYSFVTLTTLGYGDITPVSAFAESLSIVLSITGQLYLAILMAMLVGKYLSSSNKKELKNVDN